jgi:hypothetical protein
LHPAQSVSHEAGCAGRNWLLAEEIPFEISVKRAKTGYNLDMFLALLAMHILEIAFFAGLIGSSVVVIISFVEDGKELFGKDEPPQSREG